jgi:phage terminase large subunit
MIAAASQPVHPLFARAQTTLIRWRDDPALFVAEALRARPEPWQAEALKAVVSRDRLAVRSGHGVGKSAFLSWLILWWLVTRFPARVAATAPTAHQLSDVLWGEIAKWHRRLPDALRDAFDLKSDRLDLESAPNESFAAARTARREQPEAFQGFHCEHMLFIADEASGIDDVIFEVGAGAMSTAGAKTVLAGNPTRSSGYFFDAFHRLRKRWWTRRVSSEDVSRARGHIDDIIETYGRDSNAYRVRVLGEFPEQADEAVIPLDWIEAAVSRAVEPIASLRPVWGLDVARFGNDRTALAKRQGNTLLEPVLWWRGKDTMQTAGLVMDEWRESPEPERPGEILVDAIGIGAGVADRLNELGLPSRAINVAEQPARTDRFARSRDELWWRAREWFAERDCKIAADEALISELSAPTFGFTSSGRIVVESKDDMKSRGHVSPDLADAFVLTFAGGLDRLAPPARERKRYAGLRDRSGTWMSQ